MTTDQQQPGVGKFNARLEKVSPDGHRATFVMDGSQTFPGVFRREASTNEIAFWLEIESLRVQLADMQRQIEGRVTIAEEIERRREAVGRIRAERDEARAHLADMQRQADQTWQRFVASQQQIDALRAEIEQLKVEVDRLTFLHQQDHALADRYQEHREAAEREVARLKPVLQHIAELPPCLSCGLSARMDPRLVARRTLATIRPE